MKLACFLKVRQKLTGSRLSKSRYSTNFQARFVRRAKSLAKNVCDKKRDLSICCLLKESASILEQTSRSYGGLWQNRSFCTISASTFWKIHPHIHTYLHTYLPTYIHTYIQYIHTYIYTYIHTYMHAYIHTYIHAYIHTCIHTCIHTYIHTSYAMLSRGIPWNMPLVTCIFRFGWYEVTACFICLDSNSLMPPLFLPCWSF